MKLKLSHFLKNTKKPTFLYRFFSNTKNKPSSQTPILQKNMDSEIDHLSYQKTKHKVTSVFKDISKKSISEVLNDINAPIELEMTSDHHSLMIPDPSASDNYLPVNQSDSNNINTTLRFSDNQLAKDILIKQEFSLSNPLIDIQQSFQSELFFSNDSQFKQFSIGNVEVLPKNTISLEDVDIYNIPKNLDIKIFPDKREVFIIGKEISSKNETGINLQKIDGEFFVEKSIEDVQKEELNLVERILIANNPFLLFKLSLKFFPFIFMLIFYVQAKTELKFCTEAILEIDEQNANALNDLKNNKRK